jgi:hypothetical protein
MSLDPRIEAASKFLLQSPPGEINDVLNGKNAVLLERLMFMVWSLLKRRKNNRVRRYLSANGHSSSLGEL